MIGLIVAARQMTQRQRFAFDTLAPQLAGAINADGVLYGFLQYWQTDIQAAAHGLTKVQTKIAGDFLCLNQLLLSDAEGDGSKAWFRGFHLFVLIDGNL
jgi:hypothetical protein